MALIVHNRNVLHGKDIHFLSAYGKQHTTHVTSVEVWGFENLPYGTISIGWSNGAHGSAVASDMRTLCEWARSMLGWPDPLVHSRTLPYNAGCQYIEELGTATKEEVYADTPITRSDSASDGGIAVRRTRTRSRPSAMP